MVSQELKYDSNIAEFQNMTEQKREQKREEIVVKKENNVNHGHRVLTKAELNKISEKIHEFTKRHNIEEYLLMTKYVEKIIKIMIEQVRLGYPNLRELVEKLIPKCFFEVYPETLRSFTKRYIRVHYDYEQEPVISDLDMFLMIMRIFQATEAKYLPWRRKITAKRAKVVLQNMVAPELKCNSEWGEIIYNLQKKLESTDKPVINE